MTLTSIYSFGTIYSQFYFNSEILLQYNKQKIRQKVEFHVDTQSL